MRFLEENFGRLPEENAVNDVKEIAETVIEYMGTNTEIKYTGGDRGWPGDVPRFDYDTSRIRSLGWVPTFGSTEAVSHSVKRIKDNGF